MIADFNYTLLMLIKTLAFTLIVILTLALGIGANSAIFRVVDTVLLRPLPFPQPEQLVTIWGTSARDANARAAMSFPDMFDIRAHSRTFKALAAYSRAWTALTFGDEKYGNENLFTINVGRTPAQRTMATYYWRCRGLHY